MSTPEKVFGLMVMSTKQQPAIEAHCYGDCGKVSVGAAVMDDLLGALAVCCEQTCPHAEKESPEPYGTTMSFGRPHEVYLRALRMDSAQAS